MSVEVRIALFSQEGPGTGPSTDRSPWRHEDFKSCSRDVHSTATLSNDVLPRQYFLQLRRRKDNPPTSRLACETNCEPACSFALSVPHFHFHKTKNRSLNFIWQFHFHSHNVSCSLVCGRAQDKKSLGLFTSGPGDKPAQQFHFHFV